MWALAQKQEKSSLWVKWISSVYLKGQDFWSYTPPLDSSWAWKKINSVKNKLRQGFGHNGWMHTPSGIYTISSSYNWLRGENELFRCAEIAWNKFNIPRHSFTTWLVLHKRLMTKERVSRFIQGIDSMCVLCGVEVETVQHLYFECEWSRGLLQELMTWLNVSSWPYQFTRWIHWLRFAFRQ